MPEYVVNNVQEVYVYVSIYYTMDMDEPLEHDHKH